MLPELKNAIQNLQNLLEDKPDLKPTVLNISELAWLTVSKTLVETFTTQISRIIKTADLIRFLDNVCFLQYHAEVRPETVTVWDKNTLSSVLSKKLIETADDILPEEEGSALEAFSQVLSDVESFNPKDTKHKMPAFLHFLDIADELGELTKGLEEPKQHSE